MAKKRQPKHNLLDEKFGKLTAVKFIGFVKKGSEPGAWWQCKCDCGNIINVSAHNLLSGNTTSCGCNRKKNLIGKRFGKLTVIEMAKKPANKKTTAAHWLCKCDCGNTCVTTTNRLIGGGQKSCGCNLIYPSQELTQKKAEILKSEQEKIFINGVNYLLNAKKEPNKNNTSGYRGVSYDKSTKSWRFDFQIKKIKYRKCGFKTPEEAHKAYLAKKEETTECWINSLSDDELEKMKRIKKKPNDFKS